MSYFDLEFKTYGLKLLINALVFAPLQILVRQDIQLILNWQLFPKYRQAFCLILSDFL